MIPTMPTKAESAFGEAAEALAHEMADSNNVESAWFLRGFADRFLGGTADDVLSRDHNYGRYYRDGWNAGMVAS